MIWGEINTRIKGLYEAHLPVSDLDRSIEFYEKLGLKLYKKYPKVAFFWIEEGKSWLGRWEGPEVNIPYHPSVRHVAFYVDLENIRKAKTWLEERGILIRDDAGIGTDEPMVVPNRPMRWFILMIRMGIL